MEIDTLIPIDHLLRLHMVVCALKPILVGILSSHIYLHSKQAVKSNYLHVLDGTLPSVLHRNSS